MNPSSYRRFGQSACLLFCITLLDFAYPNRMWSRELIFSPVPLSGAPAGNYFGCAWGDFDQDGFIDLFVANGFGQKNLLLRNDRAGTLIAVTNGPVANDVADAGTGAWGDFDNDGDLDLWVSNFSAPAEDFFYLNDGRGNFARLTDLTANDRGKGNAVAWGDYDRDGYLDLFVANADRQNDFLFHNNGQGALVKITQGAPATRGGTSVGAAWADYDQDGDLDLFVANGGQSLTAPEDDFLFRNEGGTFTSVAGSPLTTDKAISFGCAWADYDNDGDLDLFVTGGARRRNSLFVNLGQGDFVPLPDDEVPGEGQITSGVAWGDYDNDGDLDLLLANLSDEPGMLFSNSGEGAFQRGVLREYPGSSSSCAWGDFNNDGFLDAILTNGSGENQGSPQEIVVLKNDSRSFGNTHHWLLIKLIGSVSNRSAIGAKVRARALIQGKMVSQLREISGSAGLGQNDLRAHFGLADATNVIELTIQWPSGRVQQLGRVDPVDRIIEIIEPPQLQITRLGSIFVRGRPDLRYRIESSRDLVTWTEVATRPGNTTLEVSLTETDTRFYRAH